jgi:hypothetical protein
MSFLFFISYYIYIIIIYYHLDILLIEIKVIGLHLFIGREIITSRKILN